MARSPLTGAQRRTALRALGRQRLEDVQPLLGRLDEDFRARWIAQLARVRPAGAADAVFLAFARAALDLHDGRREHRR